MCPGPHRVPRLSVLWDVEGTSHTVLLTLLTSPGEGPGRTLAAPVPGPRRGSHISLGCLSLRYARDEAPVLGWRAQSKMVVTDAGLSPHCDHEVAVDSEQRS